MVITGLKTHTGAPWLTLALRDVGVREVDGSGDNPKIVQYFADAGVPEFKRDEVPWCAAFVGAMLERSGVKPSGSALAKSYLSWGTKLVEPIPGAIVVFPRTGFPGSGHVEFVKSVRGDMIEVVGGNKHDSVCVTYRPIADAISFRWPLIVAPQQGPPPTSRAETSNLGTQPTMALPANNVREQGGDDTPSVDSLRRDGSRTIAAADDLDRVTRGTSVGLGALAALNALVSEISQTSIFVIVILGVCALLYVSYLAKNIRFYRTDDARTGKHKGRK